MEMNGEIVDVLIFEEDGEEWLEVIVTSDDDGDEYSFIMAEQELDKALDGNSYMAWAADWVGCPVAFDPENETIWTEGD